MGKELAGSLRIDKLLIQLKGNRQFSQLLQSLLVIPAADHTFDTAHRTHKTTPKDALSQRVILLCFGEIPIVHANIGHLN
jgi:hypothetical protein